MILRRFGFTLLAFSSALIAQERIQVQFTTLAWEPVEQELHFQSPESAPESIEINTRFRSEPYFYTGPNPIVFYTESSGPDGTAIRNPVATAKIPQDIKSAMLLFVPVAGQDGVSIYVMDDSMDAFPWGSVRFFNLTQRDLGIIFNDEKIPIRPLEMKTSKAQNEHKSVHLSILAIQDKELRDLYNSQWPQDEGTRHLVFIKDAPQRYQGIMTKSVTDFRPDKQ